MQHFSDWVSQALVRVHVFTLLPHPSSPLVGHSCTSKAKDGGRERAELILEEVKLSAARSRVTAVSLEMLNGGLV